MPDLPLVPAPGSGRAVRIEVHDHAVLVLVPGADRHRLGSLAAGARDFGPAGAVVSAVRVGLVVGLAPGRAGDGRDSGAVVQNGGHDRFASYVGESV